MGLAVCPWPTSSRTTSPGSVPTGTPVVDAVRQNLRLRLPPGCSDFPGRALVMVGQRERRLNDEQRPGPRGSADVSPWHLHRAPRALGRPETARPASQRTDPQQVHGLDQRCFPGRRPTTTGRSPRTGSTRSSRPQLTLQHGANQRGLDSARSPGPAGTTHPLRLWPRQDDRTPAVPDRRRRSCSAPLEPALLARPSRPGRRCRSCAILRG